MTETLNTLKDATEAESLVLTWFAEELEEPQIQAEDNFLDLGGHSMLAVALDKRARDRFDAGFDMSLLFQGTVGETINELFGRIGNVDQKD